MFHFLEQIMVIGGVYAAGKTTEVFRNGSVVRCNVSALQEAWADQASAVVPDGVVICGGRNHQHSCLRLTSENQWVPFPDLNLRWRGYFDMFYMNEKLWAIGGDKGIEYIDPSSGSGWTIVPPRPNPRTDRGCSAELPNNRIIFTGGSGKPVGSNSFFSHVSE